MQFDASWGPASIAYCQIEAETMYVSKFRQKLIFAPEVPNQTLAPQHTSVHSASALLSLHISSDVKSARHPK
jgi:hypothetical protein